MWILSLHFEIHLTWKFSISIAKSLQWDQQKKRKSFFFIYFSYFDFLLLLVRIRSCSVRIFRIQYYLYPICGESISLGFVRTSTYERCTSEKWIFDGFSSFFFYSEINWILWHANGTEWDEMHWDLDECKVSVSQKKSKSTEHEKRCSFFSLRKKKNFFLCFRCFFFFRSSPPKWLLSFVLEVLPWNGLTFVHAVVRHKTRFKNVKI